jgi:hypothetical protein
MVEAVDDHDEPLAFAGVSVRASLDPAAQVLLADVQPLHMGEVPHLHLRDERVGYAPQRETIGAVAQVEEVVVADVRQFAPVQFSADVAQERALALAGRPPEDQHRVPVQVAQESIGELPIGRLVTIRHAERLLKGSRTADIDSPAQEIEGDPPMGRREVRAHRPVDRLPEQGEPPAAIAVSRDEAIDDGSLERVRALVAVPELEAVEEGPGPVFAAQLPKDFGTHGRVDSCPASRAGTTRRSWPRTPGSGSGS